jgi:actin-like ATPase involved in cell morphogenesis
MIALSQEKYNEIIGQYINPTLTQIKEMASKFGDVVTETGGDLLRGAADATGIDLDRLPEQLMRKAEEVKEAGTEILKELGITVRVDLNSTSPELAEMFVAEIDRNPKLKSDLAGKIFGNKREYT